MRVPVLLLSRGKLVEQPSRDDELDAAEVGILGIGVPQRALDEVLVDLTAVVMRHELHVGVVHQRVMPHEVHVQRAGRPCGLHQPRPGLERLALDGLLLTRRIDRRGVLLFACRQAERDDGDDRDGPTH